jgi:hypothetical protein
MLHCTRNTLAYDQSRRLRAQKIEVFQRKRFFLKKEAKTFANWAATPRTPRKFLALLTKK